MQLSRIDRDLGRFRDIVRGRIKRNLRKCISHGRMTGLKGKDLVSIPAPTIEIPHFRFGQQEQGGPGAGQAGEGEDDHVLEVEIALAAFTNPCPPSSQETA